MTLEEIRTIHGLCVEAHQSGCAFERAENTAERVRSALAKDGANASVVVCDGEGTSEWSASAADALNIVEKALTEARCRAYADKMALVEKMREALR